MGFLFLDLHPPGDSACSLRPPRPPLSHTHNFVTYNFVTHTQLCHIQIVTYKLSHTTYPHTTYSHTHNFITHNFVTHNFVTYKLSHTTYPHTTYSHTQLCHTHNFVTCKLSHATLSHTTLSHTNCHIQLCHIQLCHTHNFVTCKLSHTTLYTLSHTRLCHMQSSHAQLCNTQLCHTHTQLCHIQLCHAQLCHTHTQFCHIQSSHAQLCSTQLCHTQLVTHNFVTHTHTQLVTNNLAGDQADPSASPEPAQSDKYQVPRLPRRSTVAARATKQIQARHQSQPSPISTTLATQNEGGCRQVLRLVDVVLLRGRRGTWRHPRSFGVASVALGNIHLRFTKQAWLRGAYGTGLALVPQGPSDMLQIYVGARKVVWLHT